MLNTIINHLLIFSGWSAIALVFALPALEASVFLGFVIPGETAVVVGGFLAYEHRVSFAGALAAAILGAVIGDSVGFWVGDRWGDALLRRLPKRFVKPEHVIQGKEMINRLGGRAVFAGRWVSVLRALVPGLCGTSGMRYRTFLLWNAIGGITWATTFMLLGYLAGSAWQRVEHYTSVVSYVLLGVIVAVIAAVVFFSRRKQKARDARTRLDEAAGDEAERQVKDAGREKDEHEEEAVQQRENVPAAASNGTASRNGTAAHQPPSPPTSPAPTRTAPAQGDANSED